MIPAIDTIDNPRDAVLAALVEAGTGGLTGKQVRDACKLLDVKQVSNALYKLKTAGEIELVDDGRDRVYQIVKAAAEAGPLTDDEKPATPEQVLRFGVRDITSHVVGIARPPRADIVASPAPDAVETAPVKRGDRVDQAIAELSQRLNRPIAAVTIENIDLKTRVLNRLAELLQDDIAEVLREIGKDLADVDDLMGAIQ